MSDISKLYETIDEDNRPSIDELLEFWEELARIGRYGRSNNPGDSAGVPQTQQDMIYNKEERSKS